MGSVRSMGSIALQDGTVAGPLDTQVYVCRCFTRPTLDP
ncbi:hypothetical protein H4W79_000933 [Nocardiopsis terrae]|uniref:Uncharacterized protein n=1 Tax=Nocardiopsis terrae TaxID=372655 RepID=A0ABR9HCH0_9ACTN|nr:hypothetical protein [Nocardiopsis terrae]